MRSIMHSGGSTDVAIAKGDPLVETSIWIKLRERLRPSAQRSSPWSWVAVVILLVVFGITSPGFFSRANWVSVSLYATEFLLLAVGQTFVIITAGIDLSDGAVLGFSAMAGALVMRSLLRGHPGLGGDLITAIGFATALAAGIGVGVINGLLIARVQLAPFIVTLGTLGMAAAGIDLLHGGLDISDIPPEVGQIGGAVVGGWLPVPFLVALSAAVAGGIFLSRTRFGVRTYAIGSSAVSARRAGVDVGRHLIKVYALSGGLSAVAGVMVMSRFAEASTAAGANDELNAIAAVVIGGASLFGGRGSMAGSVIGTAIIAMLVSGLVLAGVEPFWQPFAVGAFLIGAVSIDRIQGATV